MGKRAKIATWRTAALAAAFALASAARASTYVSELTFPKVPQNAGLVNFPLLVRVSAGRPSGFAYGNCPTAARLSFNVKDSIEGLPFEVDTWNTNGTSLVWVSVPVLSSDTCLEMRWYADDAENLHPECVNAAGEVWSRANYIGVWHFNAKVDGKWPDSTANALDATPYSDTVPASVSSGPTGGPCAGNVDGSTGLSSGGAFVSVAQLAAIDFDGKFSFSGWLSKYSGGSARLVSTGTNYDHAYNVTCNQSGVWVMSSPFDVSGGGTFREAYYIGQNMSHNGNSPLVWQSGVSALNTWHYVDIHLRADGTVRGYENGAAWFDTTGTSTISPFVNPRTNGLQLGAFVGGTGSFGGLFDEFRISTVERSSTWAAVEYAMQSDTEYVTMGEAFKAGTEPAIEVSVVSFGVKYGQLALKANSLGEGGSTGTFYVGAAPHGTAVVTERVPGVAALQTFKRLTSGTTYDWVVAFTNNLGNGTAAVTGSFTTRVGGDVFLRASDLTVAPHAGATPLENFPLPVRISSSLISGFSGDICQEGGADLRFFDDSGSVVPSEIDHWDAEGESVAWVSLASYPGSGGTPVTLTLKWGAAAGAELPANDASAVWTTPGYVGVWHLSEANVDGTYPDATGHGLTAERRTGASYPIASETSVVGGGLDMGGVTVGDGLLVPASRTGSVTLTAPFTFSGWALYRNAGGNDCRLITTGDGYAHLNLSVGEGCVYVMGEDTVYFEAKSSDKTLGSWRHYAGVFNGANSRGYADGVEGSGSPGSAKVPGSALQLGSGLGLGTFTDWLTKSRSGNSGYQPFNGCLDEMRVRGTASSADWLAAERATVLENGVTFSAARDVSGEGGMSSNPIVSGVSAALSGTTHATLSWCVDWAGDSADTVTVVCEYGMDTDRLDWSEVLAEDAIGKGGATLSAGLVPNRTYYMRLRVTGGGRESVSSICSLTTGAGTSDVAAAQPVVDAIACSALECDRFTLTGTLFCGDGSVPTGATVSVWEGELSWCTTVADDGTWSVTATGFSPGETVTYSVRAETPAGHVDCTPLATVTTHTYADVDYIWKATVPDAWTNAAAWQTSYLGASYPPAGAKSVTFPDHCCATVRVDAVLGPYARVSFTGADVLRLVGDGSSVSALNVTPASSSAFRDGVRLEIARARLFFERYDANAASLGANGTVSLADDATLVFSSGPLAVGDRVRVSGGSRLSGGLAVAFSLADSDIVLEDSSLQAFRWLDAAAVADKAGARIVLRGDSQIYVNPNNGGYAYDCGFWASQADAQISFELTGETPARTPVFCHAAGKVSSVVAGTNRVMGEGSGTGRIVLNVPKTAKIRTWPRACDIPVVAWSSEGISTNRVVFGEVARAGDSFAFTYAAGAEPGDLPTGVVYRHAQPCGTVIYAY